MENENVMWNLKLDISQTKGYDTCMLWEISNVTIRNRNLIKLIFTTHWIYGIEAGSMNSNRKNEENSFFKRW